MVFHQVLVKRKNVLTILRRFSNKFATFEVANPQPVVLMKRAASHQTNRYINGNLCRNLWCGCVALFVSALCSQTAADADVFDDFSDGNDSANPPWTHSDVGLGGVQTYDASVGNYHLQATVGGFGFSYLGSFVESTSDFLISFDLVDWGSGAQRIGAYARATGIDTFAGVSGYHFSYQPDNGQVLIRQMINANQLGANLASGSNTLDFNKEYRFVFSGTGSSLNGKIYEIGGPVDPLVDLSATDSAFTTGASGLLGFGVGAVTDFTVDNFSHLVPEPATSALVLLGGLVLGWPLLRRRAGSG